MRILKEIGFAYPTSKTARRLGFNKTGCFYVGQTLLDLEGSSQSAYRLAHNTEGYATPDDPDLIAFFHETEGDLDPSFVKFGNKKALAAISTAGAA